MSGFFTDPAEQRVLAELANMRRDIEALQGSAVRVPLRAADPPTTSPITLWILNDGRLRGRQGDGTVIEYAKKSDIPAPVTPPGGGGSTVPPPVPEYVPSTREYRSGSNWTQCYWKGGSEVYANAGGRLYYSMYTSTTGQLKSMIGFPFLAGNLAPGPVGTRIAEVWFRLNNLHTNSNSGGSLRIGVHNYGSDPGSFQESGEIGNISVGKPSNDWYQLPNWVGEGMRDNIIQGITLNQNSTSRSLYGYADGASAGAELRIVHVK